MFALSVCCGSGKIPEIVPAPSSGSACTGSSPSKLPAALVNPIGAAARWSWKLFTKKNTCVPFCARFTRHEPRAVCPGRTAAPVGNELSHEHGNSAVQSELIVLPNGGVPKTWNV